VVLLFIVMSAPTMLLAIRAHFKVDLLHLHQISYINYYF
jgi:hypothetical protein